MDSAAKPSVLIVYYTHTQQARRVADVMAEVFRERGCDVEQASIEFTDPRFIEKFSRFPFKHAALGSPGGAARADASDDGSDRNSGRGEPRRLRPHLHRFGHLVLHHEHALALISVSEAAKQVFDGKPFAAYVVCRRYWSVNLKEAKKLATKQGGRFVDAVHFQYEGGQIRSLLSLLSYFGKGEMRERSLGIKIPPTNLKPDFGDQARAFANKLADGLGPAARTAGSGGSRLSCEGGEAGFSMPNWLELLVLALASTFWPTLILIVVLALRLDRPVKILVWFLIGGLLTTVSVGIAVVFALQDASFMTGSHPPADPAVDIAAGLLSLLAAFALSRRSRKTPVSDRRSTRGACRSEEAVHGPACGRQGAPIAFVAGVVLNIVPGTFPIVALKDIAEQDASDAAKIATIIVFYVIMFAFVEIPIVAYLFAPTRTIAAVDNFNAWLGRNGRRVAAYVLAGVGAYLVVRGIVQLLS